MKTETLNSKAAEPKDIPKLRIDDVSQTNLASPVKSGLIPRDYVIKFIFGLMGFFIFLTVMLVIGSIWGLVGIDLAYKIISSFFAVLMGSITFHFVNDFF